MSPRILIGLTGNIATGKSEATKVLRELGAIVIDADQAARDVVAPGTPALAKIAASFGSAVLNADGSLDRKAMADIVFNDPAKLRALEAIVHPAVRVEIERRLTALPADAVAVIEAIRLIEGGYADRCDEVWVTNCDEATQIARLVRWRSMSEADARTRVRAQNPQSEKLVRANVVIDTSGSRADTHRQVRAAWARLVGAGA